LIFDEPTWKDNLYDFQTGEVNSLCGFGFVRNGAILPQRLEAEIALAAPVDSRGIEETKGSSPFGKGKQQH
jgi:hypothetical protein